MFTKDLDSLANEVLEIEESADNQRLKSLWQGEESILPRMHRHGIPKAYVRPFTIGIEPQMWSEIIGFNLKEFFALPTVYFKSILEMMLYSYRNLKDDTPVTKDICLYLGAGFEASIFGLKQVFRIDTDPWVGREPLIKEKSDLAFMKIPDFYHDGCMPEIHRFYEEMKSLGKKRGFNIVFPRFLKGPFGIAITLRGFENFLMDMKEDPAFAHKLMKFITTARKEWTKERANFLGVEIEKGDLMNDDVNSSVISPQLYREFILPCEKELCEFHGGIRYWHSCGDVTGFLESILEIPSIDLLDVGPWTNLETAVKLFQGRMPIEIRTHPERINIYSATETEMRKLIDRVIEICGKYNTNFAIRAGGLQTFNSLTHDLYQIKLWARVAREQLYSEYSRKRR